MKQLLIPFSGWIPTIALFIYFELWFKPWTLDPLTAAPWKYMFFFLLRWVRTTVWLFQEPSEYYVATLGGFFLKKKGWWASAVSKPRNHRLSLILVIPWLLCRFKPIWNLDPSLISYGTGLIDPTCFAGCPKAVRGKRLDAGFLADPYWSRSAVARLVGWPQRRDVGRHVSDLSVITHWRTQDRIANQNNDQD